MVPERTKVNIALLLKCVGLLEDIFFLFFFFFRRLGYYISTLFTDGGDLVESGKLMI